jgi:hypothetical protein
MHQLVQRLLVEHLAGLTWIRLDQIRIDLAVGGADVAGEYGLRTVGRGTGRGRCSRTARRGRRAAPEQNIGGIRTDPWTQSIGAVLSGTGRNEGCQSPAQATPLPCRLIHGRLLLIAAVRCLSAAVGSGRLFRRGVVRHVPRSRGWHRDSSMLHGNPDRNRGSSSHSPGLPTPSRCAG